MKLKALSLAIFATAAAVSTSHAASTNILQSISIQFTLYSQGPITTNKQTGLASSPVVTSTLTTKGFVAALGTNVTGKALPSSATLALATPPGGYPSIVVVDGTNIYALSTNIIPNFYATALPVGDITSSTNGTVIAESPRRF